MKQRLVTKLKTHFPQILFKKVKIVTKGWDHDVLILDNHLIVRFGKDRLAKNNFAREVKFLKEFSTISNIRVPHYLFFSRHEGIGIYEMIKGQELTPQIYKKLPSAIKQKIIRALARFLTLIHTLPLKKAKAYGFKFTGCEGWEKALNEKRKWFEKEFFPKMTKHLTPEQNRFVKNFMEYFCASQYKIKPVLGHYDLSHDHIIVNENGTIAGIIDFGDMSISDPAHEFNGFWDYDSRLPRQIYAYYRGPKDSLFLQRCRDHFIHRWIYLLYDGLIRRKNMSLWHEARTRINSIISAKNSYL